jgi:hypothetical protein
VRGSDIDDKNGLLLVWLSNKKEEDIFLYVTIIWDTSSFSFTIGTTKISRVKRLFLSVRIILPIFSARRI